MSRLILLLFPALTACSLYQSEGRKFLEKQAFEHTGSSAFHNLAGCSRLPLSTQWSLSEVWTKAEIYLSEESGFELVIKPLPSTDSFSCHFVFSSAQEMYEKTAAAIELSTTLGQVDGEASLLSGRSPLN